jgi:hypothetical protein
MRGEQSPALRPRQAPDPPESCTSEALGRRALRSPITEGVTAIERIRPVWRFRPRALDLG